MSSFDAVVDAATGDAATGDAATGDAATGDADVADLRQLALKTKGAESRAADEVAKAVLLGRYRYNPGLGWYEWDGRRWDGDETVSERVSEVTRQFMDQVERDYEAKAAESYMAAAAVVTEIKARLPESALSDSKGKPVPSSRLVPDHGTDTEKETYKKGVQDESAAKTQADIWLNLLAAGKVAAVTRLCQGMDGILTRSSEFDSHPDLLNCRNCVVDLRDKSTRPHDPDLLITHLAGGDYDPTVISETWNRALDAVHPHVAEWFQMRMGQAATGYTPDDDALILGDGSGENGKTAVTIGIRRALGSYGKLISHRVLIAQPGQHPTELMDLRGLRFALLEETPEEGRLNTHQLKMTIGTPQITARRMRRDDITFDTTHSLLVNTNHRPIIDATDHGTWRRLKAMPWPYTFRSPGQLCDGDNDKPGDPTLKPRLETEPQVPTAVLTYVVDGAARWYAQDRISGPDPQLVLEATAEWRRTSDVGLRFAKEHLTAADTEYITPEVLRSEFNAYLGSQGKHPWTATTINERFPASLTAAGIPVRATPRRPTMLTSEHTESRPTPSPPPDGVDFPRVPKLREVRGETSPAKGKTVRAWMGVRFQTHEERESSGGAGEETKADSAEHAGSDDSGQRRAAGA